MFKESRDATLHFPLEPDSLPLYTGELVKLQIAVDPPAYPVVLICSVADGVQVAYPRAEQLAGQKAHGSFVVPKRDSQGRDHWWPLSDPPGTLTFVLLARKTPVRDAAELEELRARLAPLSDLPIVASNTMIQLVAGQPRRLQRLSVRTRGVGDASETVVSDDGLLVRLPEIYRDCEAVTAIAVLQVSAAGRVEEPSKGSVMARPGVTGE